jgi:hypothetical protein
MPAAIKRYCIIQDPKHPLLFPRFFLSEQKRFQLDYIQINIMVNKAMRIIADMFQHGVR